MGDTARHGGRSALAPQRPARLDLIGKIYAQEAAAGRSPTDYSKPPADAAEARPLAAYTGVYANGYYGALTVTASGGELTMRLGPKPTTFRLTHYDGDTYSFRTVGENAVGLSGVTFHGDRDGKATRVTVEAFDKNGLGVFTRR
ncbi:DUF3471 domain-containing protein [Streptomyces sp. NPDC051677]|uniref:DUF3471 domain-containing protein n=1 Tax=Streptomyces sp. NPDC051677 TaxID=3365669 RepID=UPI0037D29923